MIACGGANSKKEMTKDDKNMQQNEKYSAEIYASKSCNRKSFSGIQEMEQDRLSVKLFP